MKISRTLALLAFLAGVALGGLLGGLLAIPVTGAIQVLAVRVLAPALQRWLHARLDPTPALVTTDGQALSQRSDDTKAAG